MYQNNMPKYFDLSKIDFNQIILDSSKSFCIKAGDLWNGGDHDVSSIANKLHLTKHTIKRYLKTLTTIGYLNIDCKN
jgi:Fic family protein